ncbi:MAG: SET domain-containing protein-lysine N-methyltransferase [Chlamydiota bacterium]
MDGYDKEQKAPTVIPVFKEGELIANSEEEYRSCLGVVYTQSLLFASKRVHKSLKKRTAQALRKKDTSPRQTWLGYLFREELLGKRLPPVSIHWIHHDLGFGLFAEQPLSKYTFIGEYVGEVRRRKRRLDQENSYAFAYAIEDYGDTPYTIDAKYHGNQTRFVNHQEEGNCEACLVLYKEIMHVVLRTKKAVEAGEQLTYDYGAEYWENREDLCLF